MPSPEQSLVNRCHGLQRRGRGEPHPIFVPATTREASYLERPTVQQRQRSLRGVKGRDT